MNLCYALIFFGLLNAASLPARAAKPNELTAEEKAAGFKLIFNGKDLDGWEFEKNWEVKDGVLTRSNGGGDITYRRETIPDDFDLRFEWKIAEGGNSGVFYRPGQYEYQILDNKKNPDGKDPRTSAGALYFCAAPSRDATKPPGQWNEGRIVGKGTVIEHWLNGVKVVDFDYAKPEHAEAVERLKKRGGDVHARGAFLHLQDHGDPVWFRSIRFRKIEEPPKKP